jgi:hypothetical protein
LPKAIDWFGLFVGICLVIMFSLLCVLLDLQQLAGSGSLFGRPGRIGLGGSNQALDKHLLGSHAMWKPGVHNQQHRPVHHCGSNGCV